MKDPTELLNLYAQRQRFIENYLRQRGINKNNLSIRDIRGIGFALNEIGCSTISLEMGIPGLQASRFGRFAQIGALLRPNIANVYPPLDGNPKLKREIRRFIKAFTNVDVDEKGCIPVDGGMQGTKISFDLAAHAVAGKDTILFIDPGFPVQKDQAKELNVKYVSFDVYDYRGEALRENLECYLKEGNIAAIVYANPNNPAWICMTEEELRIIGELAKQYDTIVIEDLAYFGMDYRKKFRPYKEPYVPTVAKYTDKYILVLSASKIFSYAGERGGAVIISKALSEYRYGNYVAKYGDVPLWYIFSNKKLYTETSGVSQSVQFAMIAMLRLATKGQYKFLNRTKVYAKRARKLKKIFKEYGFHIVYEYDQQEKIGDGFYFTVGYPSMTSEELAFKLLCCGVLTLSLKTTGSQQNGVRICTSLIHGGQFRLLRRKLDMFKIIIENEEN